jgi:hypothetical protein
MKVEVTPAQWPKESATQGVLHGSSENKGSLQRWAARELVVEDRQPQQQTQVHNNGLVTQSSG